MLVSLMPLYHLHVYTSGSIIKRTTHLVESVFCDQRYCCQRTCEFRTCYNPTRLHKHNTKCQRELSCDTVHAHISVSCERVALSMYIRVPEMLHRTVPEQNGTERLSTVEECDLQLAVIQTADRSIVCDFAHARSIMLSISLVI